MISEKYHRIIYTAAFMIGCCFFIGCENDPKEIDEMTRTMVQVEKATDVESYMSQDGIVKAKLTAPTMLRVLSDTLYVEFPDALHVDFYNDSTKIETRLDSKYGKYFENQGKVYLRDSVVVINIKGDTLKCPDLWWDQNAKLFYTDKYAEYHAKGKNIYGGKGLEATEDLTTVTFNEPVGDVKISKDGSIQ